MKKKDISYYLSLPYIIEIHEIPENKGGGYIACLPQIGRHVIVGDGETLEEAIKDLHKAKEEAFKYYIESNVTIPEPDEEYSGKFVARIPKTLHNQLASEAKLNGTSLNQYVTYLLTKNFEHDLLIKEMNKQKVKSYQYEQKSCTTSRPSYEVNHGEFEADKVIPLDKYRKAS